MNFSKIKNLLKRDLREVLAKVMELYPDCDPPQKIIDIVVAEGLKSRKEIVSYFRGLEKQ